MLAGTCVPQLLLKGGNPQEVVKCTSCPRQEAELELQKQLESTRSQPAWPKTSPPTSAVPISCPKTLTCNDSRRDDDGGIRLQQSHTTSCEVPNSFEELLDFLLCKVSLVIAQANNDCTCGSILLTGTGTALVCGCRVIATVTASGYF